MPQFVRGGLRYDRWLEVEGLPPFDLPADTLGDLRTMGNILSVFEIAEPITAERVAIALAASPEKSEPGHTAYAVFDRAAIERLGIRITKSPGGTIDAGVNALHYDLHVGTISKLAEVAAVIAAAPIFPITKKRVVELLKAGFENGNLDHTKNRLLCDKVKAHVPEGSK